MRWLKRLFGVSDCKPDSLAEYREHFSLQDASPTVVAIQPAPAAAAASDGPSPDLAAQPAPIAAPEPPAAVPEPKAIALRNPGAKRAARKPRAPRRHK